MPAFTMASRAMRTARPVSPTKRERHQVDRIDHPASQTSDQPRHRRRSTHSCIVAPDVRAYPLPCPIESFAAFSYAMQRLGVGCPHTARQFPDQIIGLIIATGIQGCPNRLHIAHRQHARRPRASVSGVAA
jgi:hypothetical protein